MTDITTCDKQRNHPDEEMCKVLTMKAGRGLSFEQNI